MKGKRSSMASHPFILLFYLISGKFNRLISFFHKKKSEKNYSHNKSTRLVSENGFIDDQSKESAIKYGSGTFSHSGCALAAIYNAMKLLGSPMALSDIVRYFEKHGASFYASFGTAPQSAIRFFRKQGIHTRWTASRKRFKDLAESSDIFLFTIMNNRHRIRSMLHTMCVECIHENGPQTPSPWSTSFIVHNSHGKAERYESFEEMMQNLGDGEGRATGVYMVAVK